MKNNKNLHSYLYSYLNYEYKINISHRAVISLIRLPQGSGPLLENHCPGTDRKKIKS